MPPSGAPGCSPLTRLDTLQHLMILREIYTDLMCYHNFFQPVMKMIQKNYIDEVHYRRVFDTARPPLDRLAETNVVTKDNLEMLMYMRDQVDIVALRERLEKKYYQSVARKTQKRRYTS